jgi:hypothetical protein
MITKYYYASFFDKNGVFEVVIHELLHLIKVEWNHYVVGIFKDIKRGIGKIRRERS